MREAAVVITGIEAHACCAHAACALSLLVVCQTPRSWISAQASPVTRFACSSSLFFSILQTCSAGCSTEELSLLLMLRASKREALVIFTLHLLPPFLQTYQAAALRICCCVCVSSC